MLTPEDIDAIARRVVELQAEAGRPTPPRDVLNRHEAIAFVGKAHLQAPGKAFDRWRKRFGVHPICGNGHASGLRARYSLRSLKAALEREQRGNIFARAA